MALPAQLERERTGMTTERRNGRVTYPVRRIHQEITEGNIEPLQFAAEPDPKLRTSEVKILWGVDENGKPLVTYDGLDGDPRPDVISRILAGRDLVKRQMADISTVGIREHIVPL